MVVTLLLMVLLTLIAVGLLTLSSISLRSSSQGNAISVARANARLALILAIGDVQKSLGPDQSISASTKLLDPTAPLWTGVWSSSQWDIKNLVSNDYAGQKDQRFQRWLVGSPDPSAVLMQDSWKAIAGLSSIDLASDAAATIIRAPLVPVASGTLPGAYSWAVVDENQKARIDGRRKNVDESLSNRWSHMGDPGRSAPEAISSLKEFPVNDPVVDRLISADTMRLVSPALKARIDGGVTTCSNSLMTNVVQGGLRKDLSLLSELPSLPASLVNSRVYTTDSNVLSNPRWSYLHSWLRSWRKISMVSGVPTLVLGTVPAAPAINQPETEPNLLPEVAKIQIHFAVVAVKGWLGNNWNVTDNAERRTFTTDTFLVLRFAPIITLHNPYSVPIAVSRMSVVFEDLPVGFQVIVNGRPFTGKLAPFNYLNAAANDNGATKQSFKAIIGETESKGNGPETLAPGEVVIFSPNLDPDKGLDQQFAEINKNDKNMVDEIPLRRGWSGGGAGFYFWHLSPTGGYQASPDNRRIYSGYQTRTIPLKPDDKVEVRYGIVPPAGIPAGTIPIRVNYLTSSGTDQTVRVHQLTYDSVDKLETAMGISPGKVFSTPRAYNVGTEITENASTPLKNFSNVINLGVLSLRTRNTSFDPTGDYGSRYPTRPWLSGKAVTGNSKVNVSSTDYPSAPYEVAFHQLNGSGNDSGLPGSIERDAKGRGFHITGHQAADGSSFGTTFDFPVAPPQSLADLAHANLASSGISPRVTYSVGSADAPPEIAPARFRGSNSAGVILDQSFLANQALWDDWYLSALTARDEGIFLAEKSRGLRDVISDFAEQKSGFSERFSCYTAVSNPSTTILDQLTGADGYLKAATFQRQVGGFNVNSVSEDAWSALLGSLNEVDAPLLDSLANTLGSTRLPFATSRFHMPNAEPITVGSLGEDSLVARRQRQQGARRITDKQVQLLASEIVKEIRKRGPFLSVAEFVNRRLGPTTDETQRGAIQQAINNSDINSAAGVDGVQITGGTAVNPQALTGNSAYGSPAFVMQADVLRLLGPAIHVRGDTFVIRTYGRASGKNGELLAQTWCEAVIERVPDFLDPVDAAATPVANLSASTNKAFGRRFVVIRLRYLQSPKDF